MIITDTEARADASLPLQAVPERNDPPKPAFRDLLKPAFRQQNIIGSGGAALRGALEREEAQTRAAFEGEQSPAFDPFNDLAGYERWAKSFRDAQSPEEVATIKRRIDRENEDRRLLDSGGAAGVVAQIAAGVFDPINLIPLGGTVYRSARIGENVIQGAARVGAAGAGVGLLSEAGLQATQDTRTLAESAISVGATAFLSGLLGGAAPLVREGFDALGARVTRDLRLPARDMPDPLEPGSIPLPTTGSAGAMRVQEMEAKLKSALGVEKLVGFASPIMRTLQSPSEAVRRAAVELAETPFALTDNARGVATPIAAETRVKLWAKPLADSVEALDELHLQHKRGGGELSFKEFKEEVGRAMRRNDTHPISEVAQAAGVFRRLLFDPTKKHAIAVKLLPEDVQVVGADSYLTRVYNVEKISAERPEFVERVAKWLKMEQGGDYYELKALAEDITDHILRTPEGRVPYEAAPMHRGPTQERVLSIPDEYIETFLESDIELIARFYSRSIIPDIEIARTFGAPTMADTIGRVRDDYTKLIGQAGSEAERTKLGKQRDADIRDLAAMRDRLRNTYGAPSDPSGMWVRGSRMVRNWNYISMLGGQTVSSIPDLARPVMVHGVLNTLRDGVLPLIANFRGFKLAAEEAKKAGAGLEMILDTRAMSLADVGDAYGRHSMVERGTQAMVQNFGKYSLMTPWNAALKQFSGVITQSEILRAVTKAGGIVGKDVERLAMSGIDAQMARRIAAQFEKHGEKGTVLLANTAEWTDRDAIAAFRAAVVKDIDRTIVTPGIGDRPLWMSTELGKMIGQFKTFGFASVQRVLVSGLQQRDAAVLNGTLLSVALGMGVYYLKSEAAGKATSEEPAVWVREGVDRSGIFGFLYDSHNIVEKFSRGGLSLRTLTGGDEHSRYASRGVFGALFGPTVGRVEDMAKATGAAVTGEFNESDVRALYRLVPYQNLFYLRKLFDEAQEGIADALGVP